MRTFLRYSYLPLMGGLAGLAVWLAGQSAGRPIVALVVVAGIGASFTAERILPADPAANDDQGDRGRDLAYAAANEALVAASLALVPTLATAFTLADAWPERWPFAVQVIGAVLVFDLGVTLAHLASHHVGALWRFHAVHHSVGRLYGLNGIMKHPIHQLVETTAGIAPLLLIGITEPVAVALAACTAIQLLLQHSNVDYQAGPLGRVLALNGGHRLHHLRWPGIGDVNFGLFTLVWDRVLGTYAPPGRSVALAELGIDARPDYPRRYFAQLAEPFRPQPAPAVA
jgi:sterol desaturase/sphingolipid hydroxylase (fatty acid hydroxylase superfamily)